MIYKAFMSYTDVDNNFTHMYLDRLCEQINAVVQSYSGEEFHVIRNSNVRWGQITHERISEVLQDVIFFIPVITPSFLNDELSREQFQQFLQRERQLGQRDLILPIIFEEPRRIPDQEQQRLYDEIQSRDPIHWEATTTDMASFETPTVRKLLDAMANRIIGTVKQIKPEDETYSSEFQRQVLQQIEDLRRKLKEVELEMAQTGSQPTPADTQQAYETAIANIQRLDYERGQILHYLMQANRTLEAGRVIRSSRDNAELVFVPAALFVPGPPRDTDNERQRAERFVKAYYIDKYPVTNRQFDQFVQATEYVTVAERKSFSDTWRHPDGPDSTIVDDHPVVCVYREDALAYAAWAGRRLPTRLEWERAMRGVAALAWPWGNEWREGVCNMTGRSTTPVTAFPAGVSPIGCYDMVGNVWEWLADDLAGGKLLLMGGSWVEQREAMPVGYKLRVAPGDGTDFDVGFRCAMDIPAKDEHESFVRWKKHTLRDRSDAQ
jgi:formylglycine-generating enzyme required for sulfatase activity